MKNKLPESNFFSFSKCLHRWQFLIPLILLNALSATEPLSENWSLDFHQQAFAARPQLEVRYTDATRHAFEIVAQNYHLLGQLQRPHCLVDQSNREPWLWFELVTATGKNYSTRNSPGKTRINLYRRGPYFCEIHWLDFEAAMATGEVLPLKGDLTLFCFPEKILAAITWHALHSVDSLELRIQGQTSQILKNVQINASTHRQFTFPIFGETVPLPDSALTTLEGVCDLKYAPLQGYYLIGSNTSNSFQQHFFEFPNRYESVTFQIQNDAQPRKIYICHKTIEGGGIVEGGVVLDAAGNPLPLLVQISKNFAGEKEERFYNPDDTPFSETFFPLFLEPFEKVTLTALHLYQNWGRHPTKHWSSLGAWMDYFHSSTGVTETTCYVPFKFAHLPGVAIADFRAMSQATFWDSQPQHDNVAGHSYLSYFNENWQHAVYRQTNFRSTGPNWFDIGLEYLSADSAVEIIVDTWETPQIDELRSFFDVRYRVLKPITIEEARKNFRFLEITSRIQSLRYTHLAASTLPARPIDYGCAPFFITGHPLEKTNSWVAEFGDQRGSNAIVIQNFTGPAGIGPAFSLQVGNYRERFNDRPQDTRLLLVPDADRLELQPGDEFRITGFWLPYGEVDGVKTVQREILAFGTWRPGFEKIVRGEKVADFPPQIRADRNAAEFVLRGGRNLIPVIVTGFSDFRNPQMFNRQGANWVPLPLSQCTPTDGGQVFVAGDGFGAVFLVPGSPLPQHLKVTIAQPVASPEKLSIAPDRQQPAAAAFKLSAPELNAAVRFQFHPLQDATGEYTWHTSAGNSCWFEKTGQIQMAGGRVTAFENHADLEFWWQNNAEFDRCETPVFKIDRTGSGFAAADVFVSQNGTLKSLEEMGPIREETRVLEVASQIENELFATDTAQTRIDFGFVAVRLKKPAGFFALAFGNTARIVVRKNEIALEMQTQSVVHLIWEGDAIKSSTRRRLTRGKLYFSATALTESFAAIQREMSMPVRDTEK